MKKTFLSPFLIAVVGVAPVAAAGPAVPYGALHPEVFRVESGGAWQDAGKSGYYRALILKKCSHEHCYDSLFIEWVASAGGEVTFVSGKQIDEVGDQTLVSKLTFLPSKSGTRLEVTHAGDSRNQRWIRCLRLGAPGAYQASLGRCRPAD